MLLSKWEKSDGSSRNALLQIRSSPISKRALLEEPTQQKSYQLKKNRSAKLRSAKQIRSANQNQIVRTNWCLGGATAFFRGLPGVLASWNQGGATTFFRGLPGVLTSWSLGAATAFFFAGS